jgi:hypothetical protein
MPFDLFAITVPPWLPATSGLRVGLVFSQVGATGGILWIAPRYPGII